MTLQQDAPSQAEIEFLYLKQEQAEQRNKFISFTATLMRQTLLEKAQLSVLMMSMMKSGHGCACDQSGICAAHAQAYNQLLSAYDALEGAVSALFSASLEAKDANR